MLLWLRFLMSREHFFNQFFVRSSISMGHSTTFKEVANALGIGISMGCEFVGHLNNPLCKQGRPSGARPSAAGPPQPEPEEQSQRE
jgi:hypothetical protein